MTRILRCLSFRFRHSACSATCCFCIFMQGWSYWKVFCKLLNFNTLKSAFQKFNFRTLKVELLAPKTSTFASQNFNFWKVKVQLHIYTPFSVCLYGACFGGYSHRIHVILLALFFGNMV